MIIFLQVRYLGDIGGKDVAETTRRIMRSLLNDSVAICMNFMGRGGKQAIGGTVRSVRSRLLCSSLIK